MYLGTCIITVILFWVIRKVRYDASCPLQTGAGLSVLLIVLLPVSHLLGHVLDLPLVGMDLLCISILGLVAIIKSVKQGPVLLTVPAAWHLLFWTTI